MEYINKVNVGGVDHIVQTPTEELKKQFESSCFKIPSNSSVITLNLGKFLSAGSYGIDVVIVSGGAIGSGAKDSNGIFSRGLCVNVLKQPYRDLSGNAYEGNYFVPISITTEGGSNEFGALALSIGSGLKWENEKLMLSYDKTVFTLNDKGELTWKN